ncbi:DMT family transporter [Pseudomonas syringae]|uniref:DMT family transporter n=1 Tax=Pseudomonas syringae TaxID=317 RepID=UPI003CF5C103
MFSKNAIIVLLPIVLAFLAGVVLPFQAASNATVGRVLGHFLWGALVSLIVSVAVIITALIVLRVPVPDFGKALQGPWWLWIGGFLGAIYVGGAASLIPKLGAGGFLLLVVAGQIIASVVVDHFGFMGLTAKPVNIAKIVGVMLILGGVVLVQNASSPKMPTEAVDSAAGRQNAQQNAGH